VSQKKQNWSSEAVPKELLPLAGYGSPSRNERELEGDKLPAAKKKSKPVLLSSQAMHAKV